MKSRVNNERSLNISISNMKGNEFEIFNRYSENIQKHFQCPNVLLTNFIRCIRTQEVTRFLVMYEMFKRIESIHGSIIEIGVLEGFNLFSLAHLSEIFEHRNYTRTIYGFDTFSGYPKSRKKEEEKNSLNKDLNEPKTFSLRLLKESVDLYNDSIAFNQFKKIHLIEGDVCETVPKFINEHPEVLVSMLICHCGVYDPTFEALKRFYPRMPKGSLVVLGTANYPGTPGETLAFLESVGIENIKLERLPFSTKHSFFVKE